MLIKKLSNIKYSLNIEVPHCNATECRVILLTILCSKPLYRYCISKKSQNSLQTYCKKF